MRHHHLSFKTPFKTPKKRSTYLHPDSMALPSILVCTNLHSLVGRNVVLEFWVPIIKNEVRAIFGDRLAILGVHGEFSG
jgi:hypothetical protein